MGIPKKLLEDFQLVGRLTCQMGLNGSHSGNLSVRTSEGMVITRTLTMLENLKDDDLVEVPLDGEIDPELRASKESVTHRAIYARTDAWAIVHTHPAVAITLSLLLDEIVPIDVEGAYYFPQVNVVAPDYAASPEAVAALIARAFQGPGIVLSRGHGAFAAKESLHAALHYSSALENSSRIIYNMMALGKDPCAFETDYFGKCEGEMRA